MRRLRCCALHMFLRLSYRMIFPDLYLIMLPYYVFFVFFTFCQVLSIFVNSLYSFPSFFLKILPISLVFRSLSLTSFLFFNVFRNWILLPHILFLFNFGFYIFITPSTLPVLLIVFSLTTTLWDNIKYRCLGRFSFPFYFICGFFFSFFIFSLINFFFCFLVFFFLPLRSNFIRRWSSPISAYLVT